jgi:Asp-tRNA(Asn)/Glu-tRNA(Gln) amidotransferase B subunit
MTFEEEAEELVADIRRGMPPAKWMAELLYMIKTGEISQSTAKHLQDTWMEDRKKAYQQLYDLTKTLS